MGSYNVVVIGGGIAGLVAGLRACELGLRPVVLEKGTGTYLCNTRLTGGTFHLCSQDVLSDAAVLNDIIRKKSPTAVPAIAAAVSGEASRLVGWLKSVGVRFVSTGPAPAYRNVLSPPRIPKPGLHWQGRAGDVLLRTLEARLRSLGGNMMLGARAVELLTSAGRCTGVVAEINGSKERFEADAVVLADGGFQGNLDLLKKYVSPRPDRVFQRGASTAIGDGLQMAEAVGAKLTSLESFYGGVLSRDATTRADLWPYPLLDPLCALGLVVNGAGRRFADEGISGVYMANQIAKLDDPGSAFVIIDDAIWNGPAREYIIPANPYLALANGTSFRAGTVEGLARLASLPEQALRETIDEHNRAFASDFTTALSTPRTTSPTRPWKLGSGQLHAIPLIAGITYTMGGIATDDRGRVLDRNDQPIAGLFASGTTTGGLEGGPTVSYVGGLTKSGTMSLRVAEQIAADFKAHPVGAR